MAMGKDSQWNLRKIWQTLRPLWRWKQCSNNTTYSVGGELLISFENLFWWRKEYFKELLNPIDIEEATVDSEVDSIIKQARVTEAVRKLLSCNALGSTLSTLSFWMSWAFLGWHAYTTAHCGQGQWCWNGKLGWWYLFLKRGTEKYLPTMGDLSLPRRIFTGVRERRIWVIVEHQVQEERNVVCVPFLEHFFLNLCAVPMCTFLKSWSCLMNLNL